MKESHIRNIGKLVSVFGLKGELVLQHRLGKKSTLKGLGVIFLEEKKDELLPHFVESAKIRNNEEVYVKLEGVDTKEAARKYLQKEVWIKEEDFLQLAGKSAPISLVGYSVIHEDKDLGLIDEVIEQPHQILCRLEMEGKEVLLPVNEETLVKMDKKNKKLYLDLPEGLLDIYLGKG